MNKVKNQIVAQNKTFKRASNARKRVLIAKEVIKQIKDNRFLAKRGHFCVIRNIGNFSAEKDIQNLFISKQIENCTVCALGGLMMATTILNNNEAVGDYKEDFERLGSKIGNEEYLPNELNTIFSNKQLRLIESAFEMGTGWFGEESMDATNFGRDRDDHQDRLLAIMTNIVNNKGTFTP